jgi:hypothetical protein
MRDRARNAFGATKTLAGHVVTDFSDNFFRKTKARDRVVPMDKSARPSFACAPNTERRYQRVSRMGSP